MAAYPPLFLTPQELWPHRNYPLNSGPIPRYAGIDRLQEAQIQQIAQAYKQGASAAQLAARFRVSVVVIYRALSFVGVPIRTSHTI